MKVLVTGGSGFLGGYIVEGLERRGIDVHIFDFVVPPFGTGAKVIIGDIAEGLLDLGSDYDAIFHCAGILGTSVTFDRVERTERVNVIGTIKVLEKFRQGPLILQPNAIDQWLNPYMTSMIARERYGLMYRKEFGTRFVSVRLAHAYGPRQSTSQGKAVPGFILNAVENKPLLIYGDGSTVMNLAYGEDLAEYMIGLLWENIEADIVTALSYDDITVIDLAEKIIGLVGSESEIRFVPMRRGQPQRVEYRYSDLVESPVIVSGSVSLDEGLIKTIEWYKEKLKLFTTVPVHGD